MINYTHSHSLQQFAPPCIQRTKDPRDSTQLPCLQKHRAELICLLVSLRNPNKQWKKDEKPVGPPFAKAGKEPTEALNGSN